MEVNVTSKIESYNSFSLNSFRELITDPEKPIYGMDAFDITLLVS